MPFLERGVQRAHFVLASVVGGLFFLGLSAVGIVAVALAGRHRPRGAVLFARTFGVFMRTILGWRVLVEGRERLLIHPSLILANHQSNLDIVVFGGAYPEQTVVVGKRELAFLPFFGWFFRATGNLFIDRSDPQRAQSTIAAAAATVREKRLSVWMFPEGHRNPRLELLPFKKGPFHLAVAAQAPIVPLVAEPVGSLLDAHRLLVRPGLLRIRALEPIPTEGLGPQDVDALIARTRAAMQVAYDALSATARSRLA